MKKLEDYIMVIDNVLSEETCKSLIEKYESFPDKVNSESKWEQDYRSFHELNLSDNLEEFSWFVDHVYTITKELALFYEDKCNIEFFPEKFGLEELRMKKYEPNGYDQFGWHTDVGDYASARRFLVMFYYLNDVETGGETMFNDRIDSAINLTVKPKTGRIVIFPPLWMYPHKGMPPLSGSKYILSTYCHYL